MSAPDLMPCRVICEDCAEYDFPNCFSAELCENGELLVIGVDAGLIAVFARGQWRRLVPLSQTN